MSNVLYKWWGDAFHDHVMTISEAADLVGIDEDTIRKAVKRGENIGFPVIKAGRRYVVPKKPLHNLLGIKENI